MQKEIAALIESMTKKRDRLNASIGALNRSLELEMPELDGKVKKQKRPAWTAERLARFRATMAKKRAGKANGKAR